MTWKLVWNVGIPRPLNPGMCGGWPRLRLHVFLFFWCVCRLPKSQQCVVDRVQCMCSIAVLWTPVVVSILPDNYVPVTVFICLGSLRVVCQVCLVYTVFFANYNDLSRIHIKCIFTTGNQLKERRTVCLVELWSRLLSDKRIDPMTQGV